MKKPIISLTEAWRKYYMAYMYHSSYSTSGRSEIPSTAITYTQHDVDKEKHAFNQRFSTYFTKEKFSNSSAQDDIIRTYQKFFNNLNLHELEHLKSLSVMIDPQPLFNQCLKQRESMLLYNKLDKNLEVNPGDKKTVKI